MLTSAALELLHHIEPLRSMGLHWSRIAILDGLLDADEAAAAFERGFAESSLEECSLASGLQDFDAHSHERGVLASLNHGLQFGVDTERLEPRELVDLAD